MIAVLDPLFVTGATFGRFRVIRTGAQYGVVFHGPDDRYWMVDVPFHWWLSNAKRLAEALHLAHSAGHAKGGVDAVAGRMAGAK